MCFIAKPCTCAYFSILNLMVSSRLVPTFTFGNSKGLYGKKSVVEGLRRERERGGDERKVDNANAMCRWSLFMNGCINMYHHLMSVGCSAVDTVDDGGQGSRERGRAEGGHLQYLYRWHLHTHPYVSDQMLP